MGLATSQTQGGGQVHFLFLEDSTAVDRSQNQLPGSVVSPLISLAGVSIVLLGPFALGLLGCLFTFSFVALVIFLALTFVTLRSLLISFYDGPSLQR